MQFHRLLTLLSVATLSLAGMTLCSPDRVAANEADRAPQDIHRLIDELGHEEWSIRENAQRRLREMKDESLPALRAALESESPEVVERARYLLDILDPVTVTLRVTRIELGPEPRIIEVLEDTSTGINEIRLSASDAANRQNPPRSLEYHVRFRVTDHGLALNAELAPGSGQSWPLLKTCLKAPGPVTLIDYGNDAVYLQIGSHIERRQRFYLSVLEWNLARRSEQKAPVEPATDAGTATDAMTLVFRPQDDLDSLKKQLRKQADHDELDAQLSALEILGLLRDSSATDLVRPGLEDSQTRFVTLLALARMGDRQALDSLREFLQASLEDSTEESSFPGDESVTRDSLSLTEAAITLLRHGDSVALRHLASKLGKLDQTEFHQVLAALTTYLESDHGEIGEHDRDLLRALMRRDVVSTFSWSDSEIVYLYMRALDLVSAGEEELANGFLREVGRTILEERETHNAAELKSFLTLWQHLSRKLDVRDVLFEFVGSLLASTRDISLLTRLASCIAATESSTALTDAEFDLIRDLLKSQLEGADSQTTNAKIRFLIHLSQQVRLSDSRHESLVRLMWESAALRTNVRNDLLNEILRRTGVELEPNPVTKEGKGKGQGNVRAIPRQTQLTVARIRQPVEAWLAQPSIPPLDDPSPPTEKEGLQLVEFDIVYGTKGADWLARGSGDHESDVQILDGRVLTVRESEAFQYTDRWGNHVLSRLDRQLGNRSVKNQGYRMEGEQTLIANNPLIRTPKKRAMSVHPYRYSSSSIANYRILLPRVIQLQSVILVHSPDSTSEESRYAFTADSSPQELWERFKKSFVARLENLDLRQLNQNLRLLENLNLQSAIPILRKRFQASPDYQVAFTLLRMGDKTSLSYMQSQLKMEAGKRSPRFAQFAQVLTEHGDRQGLAALISFLRDDKSGRHVYQSVTALDKFLDLHSPTEDERVQVLDLLFTKLADGRYQSRSFNIFSRELGTDFGFSETWRAASNSGARKTAQQAVVNEAIAWWASQENGESSSLLDTPERQLRQTDSTVEGTGAPPRGRSNQRPRGPNQSVKKPAKRDE
jgi:HEAT repeat protein